MLCVGLGEQRFQNKHRSHGQMSRHWRRVCRAVTLATPLIYLAAEKFIHFLSANSKRPNFWRHHRQAFPLAGKETALLSAIKEDDLRERESIWDNSGHRIFQHSLLKSLKVLPATSFLLLIPCWQISLYITAGHSGMQWFGHAWSTFLLLCIVQWVEH